MKKIISLITGLLIITACNQLPMEKPNFDIELVVVWDRTDSLSRPTLEELITFIELTNIFHGVKIIFTEISDLSSNNPKTFVLPKADELNSNPEVRKLQVKSFYTTISKYINSIKATKKEHSQVYQSLADALNYLSNSKSTHRILAVYSDCMANNSKISFYSPELFQTLKNNPTIIEKEFETETPLNDLRGIDIYFRLPAKNFEQDTIQQIASGFFMNLFKKHNASVHKNTIGLE